MVSLARRSRCLGRLYLERLLVWVTLSVLYRWVEDSSVVPLLAWSVPVVAVDSTLAIVTNGTHGIQNVQLRTILRFPVRVVTISFGLRYLALSIVSRYPLLFSER